MEVTAVILLLVLVAALGLRALLGRSFSLQRQFERWLPWSFHEGMARSLEAIACARPYHFLALMFFFAVGVFALLDDVGLGRQDPVLRYGVAAVVAAFTLYTARRSASQRATQLDVAADVAPRN